MGEEENGVILFVNYVFAVFSAVLDIFSARRHAFVVVMSILLNDNDLYGYIPFFFILF